ncbi:hypothetical protein P4204_12520 [Pseudomonas aeruginosa]|nr:hypothetical protein [Pseudomonas aeruginosa]
MAARRSLLFDAGGLLEQARYEAGEDAWASGWLEVHDRSLAWVAEAFRLHLPGILPARRGDRRQPRQRSVPAGRHDTSWTCSGAACRSVVLRYSDYWISLRPA